MKICVFPGSFDPISNGHLDLIKRSAKLFDKIYVLASFNVNKKYLFTAEERIELIKKCIDLPNVEVCTFDGMVVEFAKQVGATVILRGLRNQNDYFNELELSYFNTSFDSSIETILMFASKDNLFVSSSIIKELILYGRDVSKYLPKEIIEDVTKRIKEQLN